ncbi:MAG: 7-carboxy-7-deazaguanine synthase [Thiotrichaceae bacterium]|nr:7-carboxy-7-deazaguanine synthase [Thiotrichaceae bacterium]
MSYSVKELFYTLQGEGAQTGRAAVFCRFSGCNLWSGLEKDRHKTLCSFCDTDFVGTDGEGGAKFSNAADLAQAIIASWPDMTQGVPYVVFTGGEPLLQLDAELIEQLHQAGFEVGVETNGTLKAPEGIDWICVSPKNPHDLKQTSGQEIKLLYPLDNISPADCEHFDFEYFYLQAVDDAANNNNQQAVVDYCLAHPRWQVSLQTHKILNLK